MSLFKTPSSVLAVHVEARNPLAFGDNFSLQANTPLPHQNKISRSKVLC